GVPVTVRLPLNDCGHRFAAGHRIRLALATSYWPLVWPAPTPVTLTVRLEDCQLDLPHRPADPGDAALGFPPPVRAPAAPTAVLNPGHVHRRSTQDHVTGEVTYVTEAEGGLFGEGAHRFDEIGTEVAHSLRRELRIRPDDPLSARFVLTQRYDMGRDGWRIGIETETMMTADATSFHLTGTLRVAENGAPVAERRWADRIARDLV
ncbi:MAG TPA: CocE/NonD family hydrolase C-terminal non-catalytic domain-containing protein, partial [Acetobacteraceae bacterium]|nr:CocE/NonD family hydrolase C-terminal non-catalytic domain-containing protein [Acetobacteraceae bacterium]